MITSSRIVSQLDQYLDTAVFLHDRVLNVWLTQVISYLVSCQKPGKFQFSFIFVLITASYCKQVRRCSLYSHRRRHVAISDDGDASALNATIIITQACTSRHLASSCALNTHDLSPLTSSLARCHDRTLRCLSYWREPMSPRPSICTSCG